MSTIRKITADWIFPIATPPVQNGMLILNGNKVLSIIQPGNANYSIDSNTEQYKGVICPGFVNVHCHLELSHMRNMIAPGGGLPTFIQQIVKIRAASEDVIAQAIADADTEMWNNGIVAVGDINNTNHTFAQKEKSPIQYHSFIELLGFHPTVAESSFQYGLGLLSEYNKTVKRPRVSITPHAPYSASDELLKRLVEWNYSNNGILSIHNQETADEDLFFKEGHGKIADSLVSWGVDIAHFVASGKTSLQTILPKLLPQLQSHHIQLVHNTFTTAADIAFARTLTNNIWWCFCPNANWYIEKRLPNYSLFKNQQVTLGTDSYASNWSLSILDEMKRIQQYDKSITLETLIKWGTRNGARYLKLEDQLGSLEMGKAPGINLLNNIDVETLLLNTETKVQKLA